MIIKIAMTISATGFRSQKWPSNCKNSKILALKNVTSYYRILQNNCYCNMIREKGENLDSVYNMPLFIQFQNIYEANTKEVSTNMKSVSQGRRLYSDFFLFSGKGLGINCFQFLILSVVWRTPRCFKCVVKACNYILIHSVSTIPCKTLSPQGKGWFVYDLIHSTEYIA